MFDRRPRLTEQFRGEIEQMLIGDRVSALEAKRRLTAAAARLSPGNPAEAEILKRIYSRVRI